MRNSMSIALMRTRPMKLKRNVNKMAMRRAGTAITVCTQARFTNFWRVYNIMFKHVICDGA